MEYNIIIVYTICALITIEAIVQERKYIRSSFKSPLFLTLLVMGITYRSEPDSFIVVAAAVLNIIGCIYLMVLEQRRYTIDSIIFQYFMGIMIYIICRIRHSEPESITFFGIIIGCIVSIGSYKLVSSLNVTKYKRYSRHYSILRGLYITPIAYYAMGMQLIGVCFCSSMLVLPCVWIVGVIGYDRIDVSYITEKCGMDTVVIMVAILQQAGAAAFRLWASSVMSL